MKNLLCAIGIHRWTVVDVEKADTVPGGYRVERECARGCGASGEPVIECWPPRLKKLRAQGIIP